MRRLLPLFPLSSGPPRLRATCLAQMDTPKAHANRLALSLLNDGRISDNELRVLSAGLSHGLPSLELPGHITVLAPVTAGQIDALYRVFNTTELLEYILRFLPPATLLRVRQTCYGFYATIRALPTLQRALGARRNPGLRYLTPPPTPVPGISLILTQSRDAPGVSLGFDLNDNLGRYLDLWRRSNALRRVLAQPPPARVTSLCERIGLILNQGTSTLQHETRVCKVSLQHSVYTNWSNWPMESSMYVAACLLLDTRSLLRRRDI
jgi:hypothetical protein